MTGRGRFPSARRPRAWVQLAAGLWLFAAGVVLGLRSGLGVSPWDVLHDGLGGVTPLSFGTATVAVGVLLVLATRLAGVRPGPGTVANMVAIGLFADAMLATGIAAGLDDGPLALRLAAVVAGVGLVALGSALYLGAGLGAGPRDSLMLAVSARTGLRVGLVRTLIEASALALGWTLGGAAGVGTVLYAFGIGPAVELALRLPRVQVGQGPAPAGRAREEDPCPAR